MTFHERRLKLADTESVCPVCLATIPAERWAIGDEVRLVKTCPEHGRFSVPVWRGLASYSRWGAARHAHDRPVTTVTAVDRGCPHDCGLCPDHRQQSCCVLLEVTSRCDLACPVCFASAGRHGTDASIDEIDRGLDALAAAGGRVQIRLSGGEPTVRDDLPDIVRRVRGRGFDLVRLDTNGIRLALEPDYVAALAAAGLDGVFLQFDGVDDEVHRRLRGARLARLKDLAIARCGEAGLSVVLVPTIVPGVDDRQIGAIVDHAIACMPTVRSVHFQPISHFGRVPHVPTDADRITLPEIMAALIRHSGGAITLDDFHPGSAENPFCSFSGRFAVDADGRLRANGVPADLARSGAVAEVPEAFARRAEMREPTLGLSGMAFQDAWTLDLERLRRCNIHVVAPDARVIPFCAYNLTDRDGRSLHRAPAKRSPASA